MAFHTNTSRQTPPHTHTRRWIALAALTAAVILIPFALVGSSIDDWTVQRLQNGVPLTLAAAIVVALLALDILLPVPSSLVSTAAGALLGFAPGLIASLTGMTLCCLLGYGLGLTCGLPVVQRLIPAHDLERAATFCNRHGVWALALMRPVPVLAEASVFWAGIMRVSASRFMAVTFAANAVVSAAYCAIGAAILRLS